MHPAQKSDFGLAAQHCSRPTMAPGTIRGLALILAVMFGVETLTHGQPRITRQPKDQFVDIGKNAQFSFGASYLPPATSQWFFNGAMLAGATNTILHLTNAQPIFNGDYFVVLSDASGSVTSQVARLKAFVPALHGFGALTTRPGEPAGLSLIGDTMALFGPYYDLYPLEASSDLVDWSPLGLLQRTNAALTSLNCLDVGAPGFNQRFYRTPTNLLVTFLPPPGGSFSVGVLSRLLTDPSRTNRRPFMVSIWYPIESSGLRPDDYMDPKISQAYGTSYWNFGSVLGSIYAGLHSHAQPAVAVSQRQAPYPVLLYSHGQVGLRTDNTGQAESLASHGYVVVGIDHNGAFASVYPDGEVIHNIDPSTSGPGDPLNAKLILVKMQDIQFVMDELVKWNQSDSLFEGHLDLGRVGAFGWSMGGATVVQLCANDDRCKAAAALDAGGANKFLPFDQAMLYIGGGSADDVTASSWPTFLTLFRQLSGNAYMFRVQNAIHPDFMDAPWIFDPSQSSYAPPTSAHLRMAALLRIYVLSFFDKHLKGLDDHTLDAPLSDYPEIQNYMKK